MTGIARAARVLAGLSAALSAWAVLTTIAGGVYFTLGGFTVSSRNPVRPGVLAIVIASIAWRLDGAWAEAIARRIHEVAAPLLRAFAVPAAAAALLCGGMFFNVRAAIGADAFGYVSQSLLWLRGDITLDQPFAGQVPWPNADWTFSPLGYQPAADHVLVPTLRTGASFTDGGG